MKMTEMASHQDISTRGEEFRSAGRRKQFADTVAVVDAHNRLRKQLAHRNRSDLVGDCFDLVPQWNTVGRDHLPPAQGMAWVDGLPLRAWQGARSLGSITHGISFSDLVECTGLDPRRSRPVEQPVRCKCKHSKCTHLLQLICRSTECAGCPQSSTHRRVAQQPTKL